MELQIVLKTENVNYTITCINFSQYEYVNSQKMYDFYFW